MTHLPISRAGWSSMVGVNLISSTPGEGGGGRGGNTSEVTCVSPCSAVSSQIKSTSILPNTTAQVVRRL